MAAIAVPARKGVLNGVGQSVAKMKGPGDVGRGDGHHEHSLGVVLDRLVLRVSVQQPSVSITAACHSYTSVLQGYII